MMVIRWTRSNNAKHTTSDHTVAARMGSARYTNTDTRRNASSINPAEMAREI